MENVNSDLYAIAYYSFNSKILKYIAEDNLKNVMTELHQGLDVKHKIGEDGYTVLHYAAGKNAVGCLRYFLGQGISIDEVDNYGRTPLAFAALHGCHDSTKFLLDNHADTLIANRQGKVASTIALEEGYGDIAYMIDQYQNAKREKRVMDKMIDRHALADGQNINF